MSTSGTRYSTGSATRSKHGSIPMKLSSNYSAAEAGIKAALTAGPVIGMKNLVEAACTHLDGHEGIDVLVVQASKAMHELGMIEVIKEQGTVKISAVGWAERKESDRTAVMRSLSHQDKLGSIATPWTFTLTPEADSFIEKRARVALALRSLVRDGLAHKFHDDQVRGYRLTAAGKRLMRRTAKTKAPYSTAIMGGCGVASAAFVVSGCMSMHSQDAQAPARGQLVAVHIQQARAQDGAPYFRQCNPCEPITPKTAVASATTSSDVIGEMGSVQERIEVASAIQQERAKATRAAMATVAQPGGDLNQALKLDTEFASAKRIVPFSFAAGELGPQGRAMVAQMLPFAKEAQRLYVRGRTDSSGRAEANKLLAIARATKVRGEFVKGGVDQTKIKTTYCTTCYVASNNTETGRRANRRVEIELVMPRTAVLELDRKELEAKNRDSRTTLAMTDAGSVNR